MAQYYNDLIYLLKEIEKGNEIFPEDEDFKLALHEIYSNQEYKKLNSLISVLTYIHFKKGKFENYLKAFEEAVIDLDDVYKIINEDYFKGKEEKNIQEFYKNSIEELVKIN
ncbi:MAG: hypothetical protein AABY06_00050 [Nanoarchaeota archaeon]